MARGMWSTEVLLIFALTACTAQSLQILQPLRQVDDEGNPNISAVVPAWEAELYCDAPYSPFKGIDERHSWTETIPPDMKLCRVDTELLTGPSHAWASWSLAASNRVQFSCKAKNGPWFDRFGGDVHIRYRVWYLRTETPPGKQDIIFDRGICRPDKNWRIDSDGPV